MLDDFPSLISTIDLTPFDQGVTIAVLAATGAGVWTFIKRTLKWIDGVEARDQAHLLKIESLHAERLTAEKEYRRASLEHQKSRVERDIQTAEILKTIASGLAALNEKHDIDQ